MDFNLPIPKNWQDFESICHKLWSEIWNDPNAQKNGRVGQAQSGVDIYGIPIYSNNYFAVQCKEKNGLLGSTLKIKELEQECKKAVSFKPAISSFSLAATVPRNSMLQEKARLLTINNVYPFQVQVWTWDEIQEEIIYRPNIWEYYYPNLTSSLSEISSVKINRFSPKEKFHAYFTRPSVLKNLSQRLKEYLITLGYELSDNAFLHGKATDFGITVETKKIIFKDNGIEFNPLLGLDANKTDAEKHIGSYILKSFLNKFDGLIHAAYSRVSKGGREENVLEFKIIGDLEPIDKRDFLELYIDWRYAAGRDSARRLITTLPITRDIKEIIWTITDSYALSFFAEFIIQLLSRLDQSQQLILSIPRDFLIERFESMFNDKRLIVRRR